MDNEEEDLDELAELPTHAEEESEAAAAESGEEGERSFLPSPMRNSERRSPRHIWLISYSDFMTILMIFFLIMYGYMYLAKASLLKARKNVGQDAAFAAMIDRLKTNLGESVNVEQGTDKTTVSVGDNILFQSGHADLTAAARGTLEDLAKSVMLVEGPVIVEGHTDNVPIRTARFQSNWELSAARAFAVIEALTAAGVPAERLSAWGFGENRPVAANDSDGNRKKNRRISIIIMKEQKRMG